MKCFFIISIDKDEDRMVKDLPKVGKMLASSLGIL